MKNEPKFSDYTRHEEEYLKANYPEYADKWKPLNRTQAESMFDKYAVYVRGDGNCVPLHVAFQLFGYAPVVHVLKKDDSRFLREGSNSKPYTSSAGSSFFVKFLTERGFYTAVSELNAYACSLAQSDYYAARSADFDEFDAADQAIRAEEEAKRKAAAEKRRAARENKKAADLDHQQA